jgi:hypothetical protein
MSGELRLDLQKKIKSKGSVGDLPAEPFFD